MNHRLLFRERWFTNSKVGPGESAGPHEAANGRRDAADKGGLCPGAHRPAFLRMCGLQRDLHIKVHFVVKHLYPVDLEGHLPQHVHTPAEGEGVEPAENQCVTVVLDVDTVSAARRRAQHVEGTNAGHPAAILRAQLRVAANALEVVLRRAHDVGHQLRHRGVGPPTVAEVSLLDLLHTHLGRVDVGVLHPALSRVHCDLDALRLEGRALAAEAVDLVGVDVTVLVPIVRVPIGVRTLYCEHGLGVLFGGLLRRTRYFPETHLRVSAVVNHEGGDDRLGIHGYPISELLH